MACRERTTIMRPFVRWEARVESRSGVRCSCKQDASRREVQLMHAKMGPNPAAKRTSAQTARRIETCDRCNGERLGLPSEACIFGAILTLPCNPIASPAARQQPGPSIASPPQTQTKHQPVRRITCLHLAQHPWRHSKTRAACPCPLRTKCSNSACSSSRQKLSN